MGKSRHAVAIHSIPRKTGSRALTGAPNGMPLNSIGGACASTHNWRSDWHHFRSGCVRSNTYEVRPACRRTLAKNLSRHPPRGQIDAGVRRQVKSVSSVSSVFSPTGRASVSGNESDAATHARAVGANSLRRPSEQESKHDPHPYTDPPERLVGLTRIAYGTRKMSHPRRTRRRLLVSWRKRLITRQLCMRELCMRDVAIAASVRHDCALHARRIWNRPRWRPMPPRAAPSSAHAKLLALKSAVPCAVAPIAP